MRYIHLAESLRIPLDAVTQTFAYLAKKRVGKTYTAMVMAEEFVATHLPFVALDPTGVWWGLRASANGKEAGLPVVIIGGPHADLPLESTAGAVIADLVVDHPGYYVLDLSDMGSNAEQDRFATDFAERLYRAKSRKRSPVHLFVDEADAFIPQQPMPEQRRMLGAYDTLVRRGGSRGVGVSLISQRPAVVNKNVLSQVECLIALQILGPDDQEAIERWVKAHGTKEQRGTMMQSLASLKKGEAWFWSPVWLETFSRVDIRKKRTFDSSATPKMGQRVKPPRILARVELEKVKERIADTIERVKADDPKLLREKIRQLTAEITEERTLRQRIEKAKENPTMSDKQLKQIEKLVARLEAVTSKLKSQMPQVSQPAKPVVMEVRKPVVMPNKAPIQPLPQHSNGNGELPKCPRAILAVLSTETEGMLLNRLAVQTRYAKSGGFLNSLSYLRSLGYIVGGNTEVMKITDAGKLAVGEVQPLPRGAELVRYWMSHSALGKSHRSILELLVSNPEGLTAESITEGTGYAMSGGFWNALSQLRTLGLIVGGNKQLMRASDELLA